MSDKPPIVRPTPPVSARPASGSAEIAAFVREARGLAPMRDAGRLILALDATMSRQPTWDLACKLQAEMFEAVARVGGLNVQLAYFRGFNECRSSRFVSNAGALRDLMVRIDCRGGHTQIGKIFTHALRESAGGKVNAVVFIGDAMEEGVDDLAAKAGELGVRGTPVFIFQEGNDASAEAGFKEIARISKGAWFRFDRSAAAKLASLLGSIAVFATGGRSALEKRGRPEDHLMLEHLKRSVP